MVSFLFCIFITYYSVVVKPLSVENTMRVRHSKGATLMESSKSANVQDTLTQKTHPEYGVIKCDDAKARKRVAKPLTH